LLGDHDGRDDWVITTGGEAIRRDQPHEMHVLVHGSAEESAHMEEVEQNVDRSADLIATSTIASATNRLAPAAP
jgi:hypothetical protein